jgi:hypothetical protein
MEKHQVLEVRNVGYPKDQVIFLTVSAMQTSERKAINDASFQGI